MKKEFVKIGLDETKNRFMAGQIHAGIIEEDFTKENIVLKSGRVIPAGTSVWQKKITKTWFENDHLFGLTFCWKEKLTSTAPEEIACVNDCYRVWRIKVTEEEKMQFECLKKFNII